MAPVSRYSRPRRAARRRPTVDLPDPAGPSMAITLGRRRSRGAPVGAAAPGRPRTREGLGHAARICDADAGGAESDQGEAHGHAVVVVGAHHAGRAVPGWMVNPSVLRGADAEPDQFGHDRCDAVGLLAPDEADAGDGGGRGRRRAPPRPGSGRCRRCRRSRRSRRAAAGPPHLDRVSAAVTSAPMRSSTSTKATSPCRESRAEPLDPDPAPAEGRGGEEVRRGGGVGLDAVGRPPVPGGRTTEVTRSSSARTAAPNAAITAP